MILDLARTGVRILRTNVIGVVILILAGIGTAWGQTLPTPTPQQPANNELATAEYRIHKSDKLSIKFLYQPELNDAAIVVRPDGKISLPMINELHAEGLTVKELKTALEKAYREILLDPEITVNVVEFVPPRIFVSGQVIKPGSYELRAANTLFQVVSLAGGFTREAHRKYVLHATLIGERELKVVVVDATKLLKPGTNKLDVVLKDGDYIFVPDSKLAKLSAIFNAFRAIAPGYGIQF